jgi:FkbM family methyltransferase
MMISYAQNFEDVMLERVFRNQSDGFFIDVGAGHPVLDSVTKHFYDKGWCGINVEPLRSCFEMLTAERKRDINLNIALSNEQTLREFFTFPDGWGLSTLKCEYASKHQAAGFQCVASEIEVTTLEAVCERHVNRPIDFLKIDVEGSESEVLDGANWVKYRPRVVIVESVEPSTSIPSTQGWDEELISHDYLLAHSDGLNCFYVRKEERELMQHFLVPPNCFDEFQLFATVQASSDRDRALALLENLYRSRSWRYTEPFRYCGELLRRLIER